MGAGIVGSADEDVVVLAVGKRLVDGDRWTHELLFYSAETLKPGLKLKVVVGVGLGDGADDGDVVALGADVVGRGNDSDVDVCFVKSVDACLGLEGCFTNHAFCQLAIVE